MKIKIYIYGAGKEYNIFSSYLQAYGNMLEVKGVVTTNRMNFSHLDGYPCMVPEEMRFEEIDYVVIAVEKWKEIAKLLTDLGLPKEKILRSRVFKLPYFNLLDYLKLKESNVSILSNNCLAGIVYKELGLNTLSPTINCFFSREHWKVFLNDYVYFLNCEMEIWDNTKHGHLFIQDKQFMPKGVIDNRLVCYFNHSASVEESVEKWNNKRKQINFENIVILTALGTDEDAYEFEALQIKKKLGVYYKDLKLSSVVYCSEWSKDKDAQLRYGFNFNSFINYYMTCGQEMRGKINWIKFLNGEQDYIRF